jgi:hypothetical protein
MTTYAAATTIAGDTIVWLAVGLATTALVAAGTFVLAVAFFAVFDGGEENVQDVQHFIAPTEEARSLVPPGLPLLDPEGEPRRRTRSTASRQRRTRRVPRSGLPEIDVVPPSGGRSLRPVSRAGERLLYEGTRASRKRAPPPSAFSTSTRPP